MYELKEGAKLNKRDIEVIFHTAIAKERGCLCTFTYHDVEDLQLILAHFGLDLSYEFRSNNVVAAFLDSSALEHVKEPCFATDFHMISAAQTAAAIAFIKRYEIKEYLDLIIKT